MRMGAVLFAITCFGTLLTSPAAASDPEPADRGEVIIARLRPLPFDLKGYLRRPDGTGPFPAVVLLPGCDEWEDRVDRNWGEQISSWGYVALTLQSFSSRGIRDTCRRPNLLPLTADAYQALQFLSRLKFVDRRNVIVAGFGQGGTQTLFAVERGAFEASSKL